MINLPIYLHEQVHGQIINIKTLLNPNHTSPQAEVKKMKEYLPTTLNCQDTHEPGVPLQIATHSSMKCSTATNTALNGVVDEANKERKERNEARKKRKLESQQNNTLSCVQKFNYLKASSMQGNALRTITGLPQTDLQLQTTGS